MKKRLWLALAIGLALPLGAPAQMKMNDQDSAKNQGAKAQHFKLDGIVKSVDPKGRKLVVDHKDIPGFMAAMTMPYNAGKNENLTEVAAGDHITADVVVAGGDTHLENIKKVASQTGASKGKQ